MKICFFFAVFSFALCKSFIATPVPQATADELIFCCTDDEGLKKSGRSDTIINPPGTKYSVRISEQNITGTPEESSTSQQKTRHMIPKKDITGTPEESSTSQLKTRRMIPKKECLEYSALFCPEPTDVQFGIAAIGGTTVTDPGAFPHIVALGWRLSDNTGLSWLCGGSLVSEFYVLTAAHCTAAKNNGLVGGSPEIVRLGELDFTEDDTELQDIQIQSIIVHPEYRSPSKYHDIALLRLATPAKLTEFVRPVCLWQNETMEQTTAKAIGWGKTSLVGSMSVTLQEVVLSLFTNQQCRESFGVTRAMNQGVIPQQICAGNSDGGKDTCSGDSGGPLTINLPTIRWMDCVHHQVGITSFGIGCGSNIPAVYTRVSRYLDWIERVVWP